MFARKRAPWRLNLYFCISEYDRKMYLSAWVFCASEWVCRGGEMGKLWNVKKEENFFVERKLFICFRLFFLCVWELCGSQNMEIESWFNFTQQLFLLCYVFISRNCYSYYFVSLLVFCELMAGINILLVLRVNLLRCGDKSAMKLWWKKFTWIILPERSGCHYIQARGIIPIFLALWWKVPACWSLGTCAVCLVITRRILFPLFIASTTTIFLYITSIIFAARLMFSWWWIVVVVDGRVVVFWEIEEG